MPTARLSSAAGSIDLYYEETGQGFPLVWCYRVVTWNYRGYPPSEVPKDPAAYSVEILVEDLRGLMQHLGIRRAHVGGLSMGGGVALNFGVRHPEFAASLVIAGAGSGTVDREDFVKNAERRAKLYESEGAEARTPGSSSCR